MQTFNFEVKPQYVYENELYVNSDKTTAVFRVKNSSMNRIEVLKSLRYTNSTEKNNIMKEIKNQILLEKYSFHIPRIYNVYEDNKNHCIWVAMEEMQGRNLREIITENEKENGNHSHHNKYSIIDYICESLAELHSLEGFVHKDLKPENIIVNRKRHCSYILDFGISGPGISKGIGTEAYMSPEQRNGVDKYIVSQATDIYAFGIIAMEILTGLPLKYGKDLILNPIGNTWAREPDWDEYDLGPNKDMKRIIKKCISQNPSDRYKNAIELKAALRSDGRTSNKRNKQKPTVVQYQRSK